jgi:hypothetical protein
MKHHNNFAECFELLVTTQEKIFDLDGGGARVIQTDISE